MTRKKLTDEHPFMQKIQEFWSIADDMGIHMDFSGPNCVVTDTRTGNQYVMEDIEEGISAYEISEWPYPCEFKLIVKDW